MTSALGSPAVEMLPGFVTNSSWETVPFHGTWDQLEYITKCDFFPGIAIRMKAGQKEHWR